MNISNITPNHIFPYLCELSEEIMLPRFNLLKDSEKRQKSPGDLVTIVDIEMEKKLEEILPSLLPGSVVVGEEAVSEDKSLLKSAYDEDLVWLVDPLDGTNNFVHGREYFCVMVALHYKGVCILSAIYDPLGRRNVGATKGEGAFLNDERLTCEDMNDFAVMNGQINYNIIEEGPKRDLVKKNAISDFKSVKRLGCAGHDFIMHALGERHFSLYNRLAPWDFAPGGLILKEAGGILKRIDEENIKPFDYGYGLLSATSQENWNNLHNYFFN